MCPWGGKRNRLLASPRAKIYARKSKGKGSAKRHPSFDARRKNREGKKGGAEKSYNEADHS